MKNSSPLRILVAAAALCAAPLAMTSCSSTLSPAKASAQAKQATGKVFSYNDQAVPQARSVDEVGPLPARTVRALSLWLANSDIKHVSYAYPQYFVEMTDPDTGKARVWSLISDGRGNLVGVCIPKGNTPAWELPNTGNYELYVCRGTQRDGLSRAIMNSLSEAGYDEPRLNSRRALGLTEDRYLISKPAAIAAPVAPVKEKPEAAPEPAAAEEPAASSDASEEESAEDDFGSDDFGDDAAEESTDDAADSEDDFSDDFGDDDFGF
ncbi:MAG: hypothetical protein R3Y56_09165 [Akkermansia sp.]